MDYRMKAAYLKEYSLDDTEEGEKQLVEDITKNVFHKWNDKLEVLTRICEWYDYVFRFYPDGRMVMQMLSGNTKDEDSEWRGKDDCGHLEYPSLDAALIDWQDELGKNEGSYKFDEEIEFIKELSSKKVNQILLGYLTKISQYDSDTPGTEVMRFLCVGTSVFWEETL